MSGPVRPRRARLAAAFLVCGAIALSAAVSQGRPLERASELQFNAPHLAFDGSNFFVAWNDSRRRPPIPEVFGGRVTQAGTLLDGGGFPIVTRRSGQGAPFVAFDRVNHLVVADGAAKRVSRAGVIRDRYPIPIRGAPAFGRTSYLVAWPDDVDSPDRRDDLKAVRVRRTGWPIESKPIVISARPDFQYRPAPAFDGTNFLVAWEDNHVSTLLGDIYVSRVTQRGRVVDAGGIPLTSTPADTDGDPAVAVGRNSSLVVWGRIGPPGSPDIYGARVTRAGRVLDPGGFRISMQASSEILPSVAFDGTNYLVVWEVRSSGDIRGARVSPAGRVLDPDGIDIATAPGNQVTPRVAFGRTRYLVVWSDARDDPPSTYGARVTREGTVLDPDGFGISTDPPVAARLRSSRGCLVPRVIGMPLGTALVRIERAHCSVGTWGWRRSHRRPGRVIAQSLRPGARLADRTPVSLVVSRGRG